MYVLHMIRLYYIDLNAAIVYHMYIVVMSGRYSELTMKKKVIHITVSRQSSGHPININMDATDNVVLMTIMFIMTER